MANYCTLDEVKSELSLDNSDYDDMLQAMIGQAKGFIDLYCDREFDTTSEPRYFDGAGSVLFIDDLVSVTTLKLDEDGDGTYESTMAATDYILYPLNKTPKRKIEISNDSDYGGFASGIKKGVEINATWGYSSTIPDAVKRASIIQVCRWFKRKDTAFATVISTPDIGTQEIYPGLDPDVKIILGQYVRRRL